jgi:TQXA domain-containing protein
MTIALRAPTRRRAAALAASLALAAGMVGILAGPASATGSGGTAEVCDGPALTQDVTGSFPGEDTHTVKGVGLDVLKIDGEGECAPAYCVRPRTGSDCRDKKDKFQEGDWSAAAIHNADTVHDILANYFPIGDGPEGYELAGSDAEKAAATQAAIWHFTDGFTLADGNAANVEAGYDAILEAVEDGVLSVPAHLTLSIESPEETDGIVGQLLGPYVIHTSAASVELLPDSGLTVHHADGTPWDGPAHDGDEVWVRSETAGYFDLEAKAEGVKSGVRYFKSDDDGKERTCFFAVVVPKVKTAAAMADYETPSTSTPTSVPETSVPPTVPETTVPVTPQTSVVSTTVPEESTSTTVPVTPSQGGLPVTGAQSALLAGIALVLIGVGAAFGIVSRRRRGEA